MKTDRLPPLPWTKVRDQGNPGDTRIVAQNRCLVKVYGSDASDSDGTGAALADFIIDSVIASEAIALFNEAANRERELWTARDTAVLDVRVAERDEDEEKLRVAQEARTQLTSEWAAAHNEVKSALLTLLNTLGIQPADIGRAARNM